MAETVQLRRSNVAGIVPTVLLAGELAINMLDKRLFMGNAAGNVFDLFAVNFATPPPIGTGVANTGTFTTLFATTPAAGDSSGRVATTAFVTAAVAASTTGVSSFNTRSGAITLSSTDVVNALTFSPYNATNPAGYQTAAQVSAAMPGPATSTPLMDGTTVVGTSVLYARQDHVHPVDTSRYAASNPSNFQTPAQVNTLIAAGVAANVSGTVAVANGGTGATTTAAALSNLGAAAANLLGAANGIATLDGGGKLTAAQLPASLVGAVVYQGTWNAATNIPALASSTGTKGWYFKVATGGTTALDGINQWNVGDTAIYDGTTWDKLDGLANEVISVNGLTGAVSLTTGNVPEGTSLYFTTARAAAAAPVQSVAGLTGAPTVAQVAAALGGTTAGTVALGNDSRITGAQSAAQVSSAVSAGTAANVSGVVALANGGTGATTAAAARTTLGLATVAASGNYADLSNKPTIPTAVSSFTNDAGYITLAALTVIDGGTF